MDLHPDTQNRRLAESNAAGLDRIPRFLRDHEGWYQDLVEHSRDLLCVHDLEGRLLSVNPTPARLLGYSVEEILRIPMQDLIAPEFRNSLETYFRQIEREGEARGLLTVMTRTGERRIWKYHNTLRAGGEAKPIVQGIAHDVTDLKRAEEQLRDAGELNRQIIASAGEGILVYDRELRCIVWNPFMEEMTGIPASSALGRPYQELIPSVENGRDPGADLNRALQGRPIAVRDEKIIGLDGRQRWVANRTYPLHDGQGKITGVIVTLRDISDRKRVEESLRAAEREQHNIAKQLETERARLVEAQAVAKVGSWEIDLPSFQVTWSEQTHRIFETDPSHFHPRRPDFVALIHPEDRAKVDAAFEASLEKRAPSTVEYRTVMGDGRVKILEEQWKVFHDERGRPIRLVGTCRDVTEQKQAEARLQEYERVLEGLEENISVVDREYRYVIANRAYLGHRGMEKEEVIGRLIPEVIEKDVFEMVTKAKVDECFEGKVVDYEMKYTYPKLGERELHLSYFPIQGPNGVDRIASIMRDVTNRNRAEARLREYERVVERLEELIFVVDRDYRYVIANQAFLHYRGMEREQVIGHVMLEVIDTSVFQTVVKPRIDECFAGKVVEYDMQYHYPRLGDRDLHLSYFPIEGPTGVERVACILQDITERKRAEEDLKESQEFSQNLIQTANVIILSLDANGNVILFNHEAEEITGYRFAELKGKNWSTLVPRDRIPHAWQEFDNTMDGVAAKTFENSIITKTGEERYIAWSNNQLKVNGTVVATIWFGNDITEHKRADEALRRSEENYRNFVSRSSEGIFREEMITPVSIDLPEEELVHHILHDAYIAECSDELASMYGLARGEEMCGKPWKEIFPPDDPQNVEMTRQFVRSGFRLIEHESHELDIHGNSKVFLNSLIGTVKDGMLVCTWGIQRDITEKLKLEESRRKAEEALRENVAQLQQVTEELRVAKEKESVEKLYLQETIDSELGFGEIIGRSGAIQEVMRNVGKVAPSDATVLLLGETGTGKELVARALHRMSRRENKSFIKLNCAAIPSGLLESELFGHEKGAFTGAVARKVGRLELADGGTLFLDEIGEIPLSLQPKLLRVLQDQEFERLGGTHTLKVNFRLLAATNRDLLQSVKAREFRSDLYYRLNVFPIVMPPLRERREDIRLLVDHFVLKFAHQMKKSITHIPSKTMEQLVRWPWPGNIRELENFVERSVILTPGSVLQSPLSELQGSEEAYGGNPNNLRHNERERIVKALRDCHGRLGGPDGAAVRLGLKRTTLQSKLDQLGIKPSQYRA